MILSFRDKRTQAFADGTFVREFQGFDRQAWKRLEILEAATSLDDLRGLPSIRLGALPATGAASTASASIPNGGFASSGRRALPGHRRSRL